MSSIFSTDIIQFEQKQEQDGTAGGLKPGFAGRWSGPAIFWFLLLSSLATAAVLLLAWSFVPNFELMWSSGGRKNKKKKKKQGNFDLSRGASGTKLKNRVAHARRACGEAVEKYRGRLRVLRGASKLGEVWERVVGCCFGGGGNDGRGDIEMGSESASPFVEVGEKGLGRAPNVNEVPE